MNFTSSKIANIGKSELRNLKLAQQIYNSLELSVINRIEKGNLKLWIYAEIFRECESSNNFSKSVNDKLDNVNYIAGKIAEYERLYK